MTTIERKNAAKSKRVAIIGALVFHTVILGYMFYASSPEGEGILQSVKALIASTDSTPKA